ncbi:unnamed protein product [Moneuplotes crassus]|uniref:Uncharacterized protein n=1 Tax=Euplotes crassus TaxID=5936 RepID=A0AAD2D5M1_EUPCR|nr:unnamed protein product [Moneuplotes crassus]
MSSSRSKTLNMHSDKRECDRIKKNLQAKINLSGKSTFATRETRVNGCRGSKEASQSRSKIRTCYNGKSLNKILNENYVSKSHQKLSKNLRRLKKNVSGDIDLDETDDDTINYTEKMKKSIYLPTHDISLDEFCKPFKDKFQRNKDGPSKSQYISKYIMKSMSLKNRITKDSFRVKTIKRPYSKDVQSLAVERVKDRKSKQNLARISREVKKKFEKQFQETSNVFKDYITESRKRSEQKTEQGTRGRFFISNLTPAPRVNHTQYGQFRNLNSYNDSSASHEMMGVGMKRIKKQSNICMTTESDNELNPRILSREKDSKGYYRSQSKEKNFAVTSLKELATSKDPTANSAHSFKYSVVSGLEECDIPDTLRRMQEYLNKHETNPKPSAVIAFVNHLVELCEETRSFDLEFHSRKMQGDMYVELRKIDEAKDIFKKLIFLADTRNKYKELMVIYQQIGYLDNVMRRYDEALIWFKKLLELAWFEKDNEAETTAYINMAISYFFMGDLDKASYYHDRMMGGKLENEKSSLKVMSYNVVKNRRELKNDKNFRRKEVKVSKPQNQTLPSPREHHKTNSLVDPTINLLPHYFLGEDIVFQEALMDYSKKKNYSLFKKKNKLLQVIDTHQYLEKKKNKSQGNSESLRIPEIGQFSRPELLYLNRKPKMNYLRKEKPFEKKNKIRMNFFKAHNQSQSIPRRDENICKKDFGKGYFKKVIQTAKNRNDITAKKRDFTYMSHMSETKMDPISHYSPEDLVETMKKSLGVLQYKFDQYTGES